MDTVDPPQLLGGQYFHAEAVDLALYQHGQSVDSSSHVHADEAGGSAAPALVLEMESQHRLNPGLGLVTSCGDTGGHVPSLCLSFLICKKGGW